MRLGRSVRCRTSAGCGASRISLSQARTAPITFDIVDTPGVTTKIDYNGFIEYGFEKERRSNGHGKRPKGGRGDALAP